LTVQDTTRLETALRNAHAAGDTEAAQTLAREIQRTRAETTSGGGINPIDQPSAPQDQSGVAERSNQFYDDNEQTRLQLARGPVPDLGMNPRNLLQGFNMNDEAAGLNARVSNVFRPEDQRIDPNIVAQREQDRVDTMRRETPMRAMGAEIMGSAPLMMARAGTGAIQAFAQARPLVTSALAGGSFSAAAGAGEGDTAGERAGNAGIYGGVGALLGPLSTKALGLTSRIAGAAMRPFRGGAADAANSGARGVNQGAVNLARRSGLAQEMAANPEALRGMAGTGEDFIAERLGSRARSAGIGVAGIAGQGQDIAEQAIGQRAAGRADRMAQATAQATGLEPGQRAVDPLLAIDELQASARPLFNQADQEMVQLTPNMRTQIREALDIGGDDLFGVADYLGRSSAQGVRLSAYASDINGLPDTVPLGVVRSLARAIEESAKGANRSEGARSALIPSLQNIARELRDGIRPQSALYREAAGIWSSSLRDDEALAIGEAIFAAGPRGERDVRRFVTSGLSESERRHFFAGVASAMERKMETRSASGNPAAALDRIIIRRRLNQFLGVEAASELMTRINREMRQSSFENTANRSVNSATASRQQSVRGVERANAGGVRSVLAEGIENPLELLRGREGRANLAENVRTGSEANLAEIARVLYSQGDVSEDPLVRAIMMEAQRRGVAPWQIAGGAQASRAGSVALDQRN
jgi:hypothetical protein